MITWTVLSVLLSGVLRSTTHGWPMRQPECMGRGAGGGDRGGPAAGALRHTQSPATMPSQGSSPHRSSPPMLMLSPCADAVPSCLLPHAPAALRPGALQPLSPPRRLANPAPGRPLRETEGRGSAKRMGPLSKTRMEALWMQVEVLWMVLWT